MQDRGGGQMAAQAGLNETCITTSSFNATCQRINSLNSSLSVLGLSSLDQLSSSREKSLGFVGKRKSLETVSVRLEVLLSRLSPFSAVFFPPQEKVKAVFDNLIQLEHLNIVKFHKYWADVKENRARVGEPFSHKVLFLLKKNKKNLFKVVTFAPLPAGDFHHRVHVFRKSEAVLEKDEEKPQDHEREGATATTSRSQRPRLGDLVFKAFPL